MGKGMELNFDLSKEYGIVLEGGGARGAYQIGAWKALRETGIHIRGIAGASVGALNGALICMDDMEKAEYIWENISYSQVMDIGDEIMEGVRQGDFKSLNLSEVITSARRILKDRGFDVTPLRRLIGEVADEERIRKSDRELFVTTYSVTDRQLLNIDVRSVPEGGIGDILLASAYFPAFKTDKLDGKRYLDGGGFNNVPVDILLDHGYRDIIIIRIYGLGFDSEKVVEIPEDAMIWHIAPRQDLGGILEFDAKRSRKNMKLGYYDAMRMLYGLFGRSYYIYAPFAEAYYFNKMMSETDLLKWLIKAGEDAGQVSLRRFTEDIFPAAAKSMKLKEGWDYKDFYLAILEESAKRLRISRFHVYTVEELLDRIRKKQSKMDNYTFY